MRAVRPFRDRRLFSIRMLATNTRGGIGAGCDPRSFGGRRLWTAGSRRLLLLFPEQPGLQAVEVDIDDRRRIQREDLRQREAADDGIAERLANLRAYSRADHHRHATEQRS